MQTFDRVSYSNSVLRFHTSSNADQAGAATTVRQASLVFTPDSVSIGKYGPFSLPVELREAPEFQQLMKIGGNSLRFGGTSKAPRKRLDWPILTYAYRLYAAHEGIATDTTLPAALAQMVESKRLLWNALCERCTQAIEAGQTVNTEVLNALSIDIKTTLTTFNDSLGRSKNKIPFPTDDPKLVAARRVGVFARFASHLRHLAEERKPVPDGLEERVNILLKRYPYDWSHFRKFERAIPSLSAELTRDMDIPASIAASVVNTYRSVFKRRRAMKLKSFDGLPHPKDARRFDWFHEHSFGSGGVKVQRMNVKGISSIRFGTSVSPANSGHPFMSGKHATERKLIQGYGKIDNHEPYFHIQLGCFGREGNVTFTGS